MDYTSIHIYGHVLSDDILHLIEQDNTLVGNRDVDFGVDSSLSHVIDYAWTSLRTDWRFYKERSLLNDIYGTRRSRELMERFLSSIGYRLQRQSSYVNLNEKSYDITYLADNVDNLPIIVVGDKTGDQNLDTLDKNSLDYRAKGTQRRKSPHATMLEYLNNSEAVYGIVSNGQTLRLIRNSGQLVKLTYIEFDLRRMLDEDKYTEFCLMYRLLHASRFMKLGDNCSIMESYFNMSIESGNRIREGLSLAVQKAMEIIGSAAICGKGDGNDVLRNDILSSVVDENKLNRELIHFIYRVLFLFIIEERNLVYNIPEPEDPEYGKLCRYQDIYKNNYSASRLRRLSELPYLHNRAYSDLWESLMDTFKLYETGAFGEKLGIKPLGGVLFNDETLHYLKRCTIPNYDLLEAFTALNEFYDNSGNLVKINYSSLDVEEFGSVYEGILEMRPFIQQGVSYKDWVFGFVDGQDRNSTSSYYTRPDLVQSLIRTTLEPVIKERIAKYTTPEEKVSSLLSMKVCDAASGSGHIVLAMARTIAWYVCSIRTGEDNPASMDYRQALREVIQKCIYAVDFNPDAVELCKVVLWIEGYCAGMPLSFLDHHIRCGNSVVGISDLNSLLKGVPKEAFCAFSKEHNSEAAKEEIKATLKQIVYLNRQSLDYISQKVENGIQQSLYSFMSVPKVDSEQIDLAKKILEISSLPENTLLEEITKQKRWEDLMVSPRVECLRRACDIYTYSFFKHFTSDDFISEVLTSSIPQIPYTGTVYEALAEIKNIDEGGGKLPVLTDDFKLEVLNASRENRFFHWAVEFPEVFVNGGFDVMCGNPPWDKLQMEDAKWFSGKDQNIVNASNQSQRDALISDLKDYNPSLFNEYIEARNSISAQCSFIKYSKRFPLTSVGKIELSSLFAELCLDFGKEAWGLVIPTGIAVNDSNSAFFSKLVDENRLISLFDFENREKLFDIHRMFKFCLLTAGKSQETPRTVQGGFFLTRLEHLIDPRYIYTLQSSDFSMFNPNSKTCPIFRTRIDADITTKIYRKCSILCNEISNENPWNVKLGSMFNLSTDSYLFRTYRQLIEAGAKLYDNKFMLNGIKYVPLYEGKMLYLYNHHYGSWPTSVERPNSIETPSTAVLQDPNSYTYPWYWVPQNSVDQKFLKLDKAGNVIEEWKYNWILGFRDVTNATNERTFVVSLLPNQIGIGNSVSLMYVNKGTIPALLLLAMLSSIPFDYVVRQKIGGSHASIGFVKQFPVLLSEHISEDDSLQILKRIIPLSYFNHDLDPWVDDLLKEMSGEQKEMFPQLVSKEPYIYNPETRAIQQAELDAIFAHLYGLNKDELRYILDPEDVLGDGCVNQTFRVLKDNEIKKYGEFRTRRLVLEAWDRFGF